MFFGCSYFLAKSEAEVLINSVLIKRKAGMHLDIDAEGASRVGRRNDLHRPSISNPGSNEIAQDSKFFGK